MAASKAVSTLMLAFLLLAAVAVPVVRKRAKLLQPLKRQPHSECIRRVRTNLVEY
jgi:hypothetical protein